MMNKYRLKEKMEGYGDTQKTLADAIGISLSCLNAKINESQNTCFRQSEINFIRHRYGLSPDETAEIFFADKLS